MTDMPSTPRTSPKMRATQRDWVYAVCTLVTGLGIGWFLGMASEALTGTVLTGLLTLVTGTAGILAGVGIATTGQDGATRADPILITILILGLVGGSITATYAKSNFWPRPDAEFIARQTGLSKEYVNRRVFDKTYAPVAGGAAPSVTSAIVTPDVSTCARLKSLLNNPAQLAEELRKLNNSEINKILLDPKPNRLAAAVRGLCPE
jgi:hypothetical protein